MRVRQGGFGKAMKCRGRARRVKRGVVGEAAAVCSSQFVTE